jgi:probable HAF family extracellular repeat protein
MKRYPLSQFTMFSSRAQFRSRMFSSFLHLCALFLLLTATVASVHAQSPQYTVTDLGPFIYPSAINDSGQIIGASIHGRGDAILYAEGVSKVITPLDGASARAWGINNFGDVVGEVLFCDRVDGNCVNSRTRAFIYSSSKNTYTILGTLGGRASRAYGINDYGQVTGYSDIASGDSIEHAFIFKDGSFTDIGAALGSAETLAVSINASGQVVGYASSSTLPHGAFLYDGGFFLFFEPRGGAGDINNRGEVVGGIGGNDDGSGRAFLYSHGANQDLGTLYGWIYAKANAINNVGQVVGVSSPNFLSFEGQKAFIYSGGVMQDLNTLIPAIPGRVLTSAADINDAGQIVTNGQLNGEDHGFLLTPTQPMLLTEPSTSKAIVVQSVMFLRDPFAITTTHNLSTDTRTRLTILARNIETTTGENVAPPTVNAVDSLQRAISLPVEFVGKVPQFSWLTQIVVRLPDELEAAGEIQLSISVRGRTSNKAVITVAARQQ